MCLKMNGVEEKFGIQLKMDSLDGPYQEVAGTLFFVLTNGWNKILNKPISECIVVNPSIHLGFKSKWFLKDPWALKFSEDQKFNLTLLRHL